MVIFRVTQHLPVLFPGFSLAVLAGINRDRDPENPGIVYAPVGVGIYGLVALAVRAHPDSFFLKLLNHIRVVKDLLSPAVEISILCYFGFYKPVPVIPVFELSCNGLFQCLSIPCRLEPLMKAYFMCSILSYFRF